MKKLAAGSGEFQFERKYENPWSGPITFTIWLDGNSVPRANAEDGPLFSRWRVTPFRHQIIVVDPKWMDERVSKPEYRAAVLAWAVQGRERGCSTASGRSRSLRRLSLKCKLAWTRCTISGSSA